MDRSWMSKPKQDSAYKSGVEQFLSFAFRDLPQDGEILCPCKNCKNKVSRNCDDVRTHLRCDGILQGYTTWVHHGEDYDAPSFEFAHVPNENSIFQTFGILRMAVQQDGHGRLDDMQGLLQAAFVHGTSESYETISIMSDNENDGFTSEFVNMEHNVAELPNPVYQDDDSPRESDTHANFMKDANTALYHGCETFSRLSFLVTLYHQKCLHGWTQESFTSLLHVLSDAFPQARLPKSYYEAKKIIRGLGLDYVKIHAYPNDCMLYRGDKVNDNICHVCGTSRWKNSLSSDSPNESKRKKIPAKVLRYFPLIPRIQRLFASKKTSDDMRWHHESRTKDGKLRHPADGEAWKDFDVRYPDFSADIRNVRLGLASDGFNPFQNLSSKHSTWPVMLIPYNLPPWICMKQTNLILSMIIPGPSSPGKDIDIYLEPLIDELLELWQGVKTFDASSLRSKGKIVAKGQLVTTDYTRVILGTMLGNDFLRVYVDALENITRGNTGDEILPRPTEDIRTIKDDVGYVIAWPRTHVKRCKSLNKTGNNLHEGKT